MARALLTLRTPAEVAIDLATRLKALRLRRNWSRGTLAERSGVSQASLRRLEVTGKASLELVLKVAHALDRLDDLEGVFLPPAAGSVAELEARHGGTPRRRGRL